MRAHVIENGWVVNTIEVLSLDALPDLTLLDAEQGGFIGDSWNGVEFVTHATPIDPAEVVTLVQKRLDDWAKTRNYDGILSLCTYATSSIPKFALEGQRGVDLRDQTWAALYALMAGVEAGSVPVPTTYAEVEAVLPSLSWPT